MSYDIRSIQNINHLIMYFSKVLNWDIDTDSFDDIDDISYDFSASDLGLKEEAFAKIKSIKQLPPMVDGQKWGIFSIEFDSKRFEVTALRKVLSGLVPSRRNSADHAVWSKEDLLFLCFWGEDNNRTIGVAHFEDKQDGLPQIKMTYCSPAMEDTIHIHDFVAKIGNLTWPIEVYNYQKWHDDWSKAFTTGYKQVVHDSQTLTIQLAKEAIGIRDRILETLKIETEAGYVHQLYKKFRETLIHDMSEKDFADMYAQTVVYGLFSARCMDETQDDFSATEAVDCIPNTNPFLKSLMKECLGNRGNSKLSFDELEIGNVVDLLMHTNTEEIIRDFNRQTGGGKEDPVIHFYEEFLTAYDKTQKVQRGVYYTPQPVVDFMVRVVDSIIRTEFGMKDGLASTETVKIKYTRQSKYTVDGYYHKEVEDTKEVPAIQILDPATGTGTFVRQTIIKIFETFKSNNSELSLEELNEEWNRYVHKHLLPRLSAFELMMAPYAVAHMKLAMVLRDTGYTFSNNDRLHVYLTNSLEEAGKSDRQISMFDEDPLAMESIEANAVKKQNTINVIIGNPPYSTESSNHGEWIEQLMNSYKRECDGVTKLQERNSKPINDDYIKFIRLGQNIIDQQNCGIMAFITPHGFLDGPIFRGMRSSLLKSFNKIYVLNLHGNANRREVAPDGSKDENVFDIKQGVCIGFFIKTNKRNNKNPQVFIADLWGQREEKYKFLKMNSFNSVDWKEIYPTPPYNYFYLTNEEEKNAYYQGISVKDLFPVNGVGVMTAHDDFLIAFDKESLIDRFCRFKESDGVNLYEKFNVKPKRGWDILDGWKHLQSDTTQIASYIKPIMYRPFDIRYIFYQDDLVWRTVHKVMDHMVDNENIALLTARSNKAGHATHFFVTSYMGEYKCGERTTNSIMFPLYIKGDDFSKRTANFNEEELSKFNNITGLEYYDGDTECYGEKYNAKNLFSYIYGYLCSNRYRIENESYLCRDFPVVPYPQSLDQFWKVSQLGEELINVQLFKTELQGNVEFLGENRNVDSVVFRDNRIYINSTSYFSNVTSLEWEYVIGGYEVCQRWLKERRGNNLTNEDILHYIKMILALKKTTLLIDEIDKIVEP